MFRDDYAHVLLRRKQFKNMSPIPSESGAVLINLDSKLRTLITVLQEINFTLVNSTTQEILAHKPVFDKEKLKIIKLQNEVERGYALIHEKNPRLLFSERLDTNTGFNSYNKIAFEINDMIGLLLFQNATRSLSYESSKVKQNKNARTTRVCCSASTLLCILGMILVFCVALLSTQAFWVPYINDGYPNLRGGNYTEAFTP